MDKKTFLWLGCGWMGLVMIFSWVGYRNLDPDFGWHLRTGEMLLTSGIPKTDPFSYTMPSFPWVDHGRLSDELIYRLYSWGGMGLTAMVFGAIAVGAVMIAIPMRLWKWAIVPMLLGTGVFLTRAGIRPQVEDWLGLAIVMRMLRNDFLGKKARWLVVILFYFWANFHGGFGVGLMVLGLGVGFNWIAKKANTRDLLMVFLAVLVTLLTPYGINLWWEIWLTISDSTLRGSIAEWQPFFVRADLGYWLVAALVGAVVSVEYKKIPVWEIVVMVVLFGMGMSSLRYMPLFVLAGTPMVAAFIEEIYRKVMTNEAARLRAVWFYKRLLAISALVFWVDVGLVISKTFTGRWIDYPVNAVEFLRRENYPGEVFSSYGWGGFLIWKLPEKKVFIDGRMPSWRWKAPPGESDRAFGDYKNVVDGGEFEAVFDKYNVRVVLWGKPEKEAKEVKPGRIFEWLVRDEKKKRGEELVTRLERAGWKKTYQDDVAAIYVRQ